MCKSSISLSVISVVHARYTDVPAPKHVHTMNCYTSLCLWITFGWDSRNMNLSCPAAAPIHCNNDSAVQHCRATVSPSVEPHTVFPRQQFSRTRPSVMLFYIACIVVIKTHCVSCAVRTGCLNLIQFNYRLWKANHGTVWKWMVSFHEITLFHSVHIVPKR